MADKRKLNLGFMLHEVGGNLGIPVNRYATGTTASAE